MYGEKLALTDYHTHTHARTDTFPFFLSFLSSLSTDHNIYCTLLTTLERLLHNVALMYS